MKRRYEQEEEEEHHGIQLSLEPNHSLACL